MSIRVLLADDQPLLLQALQTILESHDGIEVVATATDGRSAIESCASASIDVAILDIRMPGLDGIGAAQALLATHPHLKVIMLTTFNDPELVDAAIRAGVHGFLLKDADPKALISAVRSVHEGESVLASGVTGSVLSAYREAVVSGSDLSPVQRQGLSLATRRELQVLELIAQGLNNQEIAAHLVVAETTVKSHVSALLHKLQARDRVALVLIAQKAGISSRSRS